METNTSSDLTLRVRIGFAQRMAAALRMVCDAADEGIQPYQAFNAARDAENQMDAVARDLIWELLNKHNGHDQALCECSNYGVHDAIGAVRGAMEAARKQFRPIDDRFMDTAEYRRCCVEAAQWTGHCVEHLLAE